LQLVDMMPQLQIGLGLINVLILAFIVPLRNAIKDLSDSDRALAARIAALELKVAENYVQRNEVTEQHREVLKKLDSIEQRLQVRIDHMDSAKVDK